MITFNKETDFISIIAPSSSCRDAENRLEEAKKILVERGFKVLVDDKIFAGDELPFFAAPKTERLRMFKEAMENSEVKIIWAFRGGYSCGEFAQECFDIKMAGDKILIGYSDITVLHLLLNQYYNMPSIHGSVLTSLLPSTNQDIQEIINIIEGEDSKIAVMPINKPNENNIVGKVSGGNLTVLTKMIGTKLSPNLDKKILILEDVNEKGYAIHRNLMQLKNAGMFDNVKAIIFGDFTNSDGNETISIEAFCRNHIPQLPTYHALGIGHGQINHPFIMNHEAVIEGNYLNFTSPFQLIGS
ncbi:MULTISPECIES: LD-carboxypeptidase [unclassified Rickettsia]|uniref:LD-carboxypeptidase n=1 Tax=unclassified Rickettsia TaxID=114295 RepID=UPI00209C72FE|nr:LD-carboxypeptidase [Rickettsia endosymbiont of Ceutorhynchus assimilis]